jgi:hypothetical protein
MYDIKTAKLEKFSKTKSLLAVIFFERGIEKEITGRKK